MKKPYKTIHTPINTVKIRIFDDVFDAFVFDLWYEYMVIQRKGHFYVLHFALRVIDVYPENLLDDEMAHKLCKRCSFKTKEDTEILLTMLKKVHHTKEIIECFKTAPNSIECVIKS